MSPNAPLPPRYSEDWRSSLEAFAAPRLHAGVHVLDVGSGRRPAILPASRPSGCRYVGLDISLDELRLAPQRSYDEAICDDLKMARPQLARRFNLIVCWNVLEHVAEPAVALGHLRSYLTATGRLIALLSGRYSCFGFANRLLPEQAGRLLAAYVTRREPETVFPAHYHDCYYDGLARLLSEWGSVTIYPQYRGEVYFRFSETAHRAYLAYESWAHRGCKHNLATHYLVIADR